MLAAAIPVLFILLCVVGIVGFYIFWKTRKILREAKNYERGLKMVPLLIHLPPSSDDVEAGSRDHRDIADENISKASNLYSILASTIAKGFKSKIYGQKHISLEIIAYNGKVQFFTAVPITLVPVVEQAILGAYSSARLEEVAEHNIFSSIGKLSGTIGGEFVLKESYTKPIATYQDLKRDTMQALLNSLSKLEKEDGVGIQILIRPAKESWTRKSKDEASRLREGKKKRTGIDMVLWGIKELFVAVAKAPDPNEQKGLNDDNKPVSGLDQALAEAIEEKTKSPGFETLIRVVASSNISHKSQVTLSAITSTFALFDAPGKNGFKFVPARNIESFVTSYILRFFPAEQKSNILNSVELATLYHLPDSSIVPTTQLERQRSKQVDGPRQTFDETDLLLGYNVFRGIKKPIRLSVNDRRRHTYIIGETGTGKSTFLENFALQDIIAGRGFAFVDPHGDVVDKLLGMIPKERTEDVIYFNPSDMEFPFGLNLFDFKREEEKDFLIQETINIMYSLYDPNRQGMIGARFEQIFRNSALLLMSDPAGGTFIDIPKTLVDPDYVKQKLKYVKDQNLLDYWTKEWPAAQRSNDAGEVTSWVASKFGAFLSNTMMRNIIGQNKSSFDMREIMDSGKILLVNLSKGLTGELNAKLLGMIFVMKFQAAAMSRADTPEPERKDFSLFVDEFQNFSTDSFASILSEARKYRLNLVVANQYIGQLSDDIRDAVLGNVGTAIAFRVGQGTDEVMAKYMKPIFDEEDLRQIPNFNCAIRTQIGGIPTQPFSMAGLPPLGNYNEQLADAIKQLSGAKFGKPRAEVEKEIFARLKTEAPAKPAFGAGASPFGAKPGLSTGPGAIGATNPASLKPSAPPSFLDDWLAKRKQGTASSTPQPIGTGPVNPFSTTPKAPSTPFGPPSATSPFGAPSNPTQPVIQSTPNNINPVPSQPFPNSLPSAQPPVSNLPLGQAQPANFGANSVAGNPYQAQTNMFKPGVMQGQPGQVNDQNQYPSAVSLPPSSSVNMNTQNINNTQTATEPAGMSSFSPPSAYQSGASFQTAQSNSTNQVSQQADGQSGVGNNNNPTSFQQQSNQPNVSVSQAINAVPVYQPPGAVDVTKNKSTESYQNNNNDDIVIDQEGNFKIKH